MNANYFLIDECRDLMRCHKDHIYILKTMRRREERKVKMNEKIRISFFEIIIYKCFGVHN